MKEITDNLKRDVKELLGESAGLVTGFFKRGACTVRAVADKWKAFARDISGAVDTLMKPSFVEGGPEAPALSLDPEAEPVVTVTESLDGTPAVGQQMTLSEANELVGRLGQEYQKAKYAPAQVMVKIDYTRNGQTDRYWLPLEIGAGGNLLEQMKARLDALHTDPEQVARLFDSVPEEHRAAFKTELTPFVNESVNELSTGLLHYFHRHCDIAALERQFDAQASILPEKQQQAFREAAQRTVVNLRRAVNTGVPQAQPAVQKAHREQVAAPGRQAAGKRTRSSVRTHIGAIKEGHTAQTAPHRSRVKPRQPGR